MKAYLAVIADDLALAAVQMGGAQSPCIVLDQGLVVACDTAAQAQGVTVGQSRDTAMALTDAPLLERAQQTENDLMQSLANWAYRHSSWVHLDGRQLIIEVAGSLKLFGSLEVLWQRIHFRLLRDIGRCRIALGPNPEAALQLARLEWQTLDLEQSQEWLPEISVHNLPLPAEQVVTLQNLGLNHVKDLLQLSSAQIARRFPKGLMDYLNRLLGRVADPRSLWQPSAEFSSHLWLQQSATASQSLIFPLKRLVEQLEQFLQAHQWVCTELRFELTQENRQTDTLTLALGAGTCHAQDILEPLKLKLNQWTLKDPVCEVRLNAERFLPWEAENGGLFEKHSRGQQHQLLRALETRLGPSALLAPHEAPSWLPEIANQCRPFGDTIKQPAQAPQRPSWLLETPKPIAPPADFLRGPERIESHWWQNQGARRDYFLAWQDGALIWVFKDLRTQRWYLHGLFG